MPRHGGVSCGARAVAASWLKRLFAALLLAALALLASFGTQEAAAVTGCDRYASVKGSDGGKGTLRSPFRTAQRLADSLRSGQTGCLRGGTYREGDRQLTLKRGGKRGERIVIRSYPGERATIAARIYVPEAADYITFRGLRLDGSGGPLKSRYRYKESPVVRGDHTSWIGNDISNRDRRSRYGGCFIVGSVAYGLARGTRIVGNRIHGCGRLTPPDNHAIYLSKARNTLIKDNKIYGNGERGIQLYPDARGTRIVGNVIDGNGQGVVFSGKGRYVSSDNTVRNNIISNSRAGWNVYSSYGETGLVGKNNRVFGNCLWASSPYKWANRNGGVESPQIGFRAYENRVARPLFVDRRSGDFRLRTNSPCRGLF